MKELTLYIDRWYIIGAVCTDGVPRLIEMPNHEDRFWLYFYEDVNNDRVIYGKDNERHWRDREAHYYGDIFSLITNQYSKFVYMNEPVDFENIFQASGIFDDMKIGCGKDPKDIPVYLSFSEDITYAERLVFKHALENEHDFHVKECVAYIEHLALEYEFRYNKFQDDGYFLILNACNENLRYSLYKHGEGVFVRASEKVLLGYGSDLRKRALVETVVDSINRRNVFLKTKEEKEEEYLRMNQYADKWLEKLNNENPIIPVVIPDVTFSKQLYNRFSVPIIKKKLDECTKAKVDRVIMEIISFVKDSSVGYEEVKGVLFIGNTFINSQYKQSIKEKFLIDDNELIVVKDSDLAKIVGAYSVIDCKQFIPETRNFVEKSEQELQRLQNAIEETKRIEEARIKEAEDAEKKRQAEAEKRKYEKDKDNVLRFEENKEFSKMKECSENILKYRPDDDFAKKKLDVANLGIADEVALTKQYNTQIILAKNSFNECRWADALSQSSAALSMRQTPEAKRINDESSKKLNELAHIKDYLSRADAFISAKSYEEALTELQKVLELDISNEEASTKKSKIVEELDQINKSIKELEKQEVMAEQNQNYDSAMDMCKRLIEVDIENVKKWTIRFQNLHTQKDNLDKLKNEVNRINKEIENAISNNDWEKVIKLCQSGINVQRNVGFEEKLKYAEEKFQELLMQNKNTKIQEQIIEADSQRKWQSILDIDKENPQLPKDKVLIAIIKKAKMQRRIEILEKRKGKKSIGVSEINVAELDGIKIPQNGNETNELANLPNSMHHKMKLKSDVEKNGAVANNKPRFPKLHKQNLVDSSNEVNNESMEQANLSQQPKRRFPKLHGHVLDDTSNEIKKESMEQTNLLQQPKRKFPRLKGKN